MLLREGKLYVSAFVLWSHFPIIPAACIKAMLKFTIKHFLSYHDGWWDSHDGLWGVKTSPHDLAWQPDSVMSAVRWGTVSGSWSEDNNFFYLDSYQILTLIYNSQYPEKQTARICRPGQIPPNDTKPITPTVIRGQLNFKYLYTVSILRNRWYYHIEISNIQLRLFFFEDKNLVKKSFIFNIYIFVGSPDGSMTSVLWAKTQQLQEDAFRQIQNIYGKVSPTP